MRRWRTLWTYAALGLGPAITGDAHADINLELRVQTPTVYVGDQFVVELYAVSDHPVNNQTFSAMEVVLAWDAGSVQLVELLGNGDVDLIIEGFPVTGSNGLNEVEPPQDGDGFYIAWAQPGVPAVATPGGTLVTTFLFAAQMVDPAAEITILESGGSPPIDTTVFSATVPNLSVTGTLTGLEVNVRPIPCGPADLNQDGVLDFFDVQMFLQGFDEEDSISDFATPYGTFDFFDVLVYLQLFFDGCTPPASLNLAAVAEELLNGDPFVVVLGDSHAEEFPARLWYGFKSVTTYRPTSYSNGLSNHPARLVRSVPLTTSRPVDASTSFRMHEGWQEYYAVPSSRLEEFIDDAATGWTPSIRITAGNGSLIDPWIGEDDLVQIKPLFLGSVAGLQQPAVRINGVTYECTGLTPGLLGVPAPFVAPSSDNRIVVETQRSGSLQSLIFAGSIVQKVDSLGQRLPGPHEVWKSANTWQHQGMICNCPSFGEKQFTREQMRADLLARSVSSDQQPVVVVMLANQMNTREEHRAFLTQYMEESLAWFDGVSTRSPLVLFIVSFAHNINGDREREMRNADEMAWAARDVCLTNPRASYVSIFALMGRTYAATDEHAGAPVNLPFRTWALANGFDDFTYDGQTYDLSWDWLDESLHHLRDAPTAAAAGTLVRDEMLRALGELP